MHAMLWKPAWSNWLAAAEDLDIEKETEPCQTASRLGKNNSMWSNNEPKGWRLNLVSLSIQNIEQ